MQRGGTETRRERSETIKLAAKRAGGGKRCQKCGDGLQGRRFIERDGVRLCERDWKEMFLPKVRGPSGVIFEPLAFSELTPFAAVYQCRRCSLPIETAAVSSSDGQLKGKWHRGCFTCAECDHPFESNIFYVHDDKPYCQLHYHKHK
jgi:formylmethanofuran dehydrogenase subunit E